MADVGTQPGSWSALSTVPSFALPDIEDDGELDDDSIGAVLPFLHEGQGAAGTHADLGARCRLRQHNHLVVRAHPLPLPTAKIRAAACLATPTTWLSAL